MDGENKPEISTIRSTFNSEQPSNRFITIARAALSVYVYFHENNYNQTVFYFFFFFKIVY